MTTIDIGSLILLCAVCVFVGGLLTLLWMDWKDDLAWWKAFDQRQKDRDQLREDLRRWKDRDQ